MPATNVVLISRHWRESAEFLTRARTSNDRDVIGRTRMSDFTWRGAPGPGSEAAFLEENFYRVAHRRRREKERERERERERKRGEEDERDARHGDLMR